MNDVTIANPASTGVTLDDVQRAAARLAGQIENTPCVHSRTLSQITGARGLPEVREPAVHRELQGARRAELAGALTAEQRERGVIAVSAGNHAQGVAYHAQRLGVPAVIVMPRFTPTVKIERTRGFGAEVVLAATASTTPRKRPCAGAGARADAGAPVRRCRRDRRAGHDRPGDAGRAAGSRLPVRGHRRRRADQRVWRGRAGAQAGHRDHRRADRPVSVDVCGVQGHRDAVGQRHAGRGHRGQAAGAAHARDRQAPGRRRGAGVRGDIEHAIVLLLEIEKTVVEGAGGAGLAALLRHKARFAGKKVGIILCGGNIDPMVLADIIERGMVRAGRLARIRIATRDVPGELARAATWSAPPAPTSRKSSTSAPSPRCLRRMRSWRWCCRPAGPSTSSRVLRALRDAGLPAQFWAASDCRTAPPSQVLDKSHRSLSAAYQGKLHTCQFQQLLMLDDDFRGFVSNVLGGKFSGAVHVFLRSFSTFFDVYG
jgi:threonine dehydratase